MSLNIIRCQLILVALLSFGAHSAALASVNNDAAPPTPVTFSDGSIATPIDHCGEADLCATIKYPNGEILSMYSEGAAYCQPFLILYNRVNGPTTIYTFSRPLNHDPVSSNAFGTSCGNTRPSQLTFDHGLIHLTVDEYKDGSLRFLFTTVASK